MARQPIIETTSSGGGGGGGGGSIFVAYKALRAAENQLAINTQ